MTAGLRFLLILVVSAAFGAGLVACGDDVGPSDGGSLGTDHDPEDYSSHCDQFGNRVYLSQDDTRSSPGIFVLAGDCEGP